MAEKILIVDDTQLIRTMYEDKLSDEGYDVDTAQDGWEGYRKAQSWIPDLILLDMVMPKMGGLETLQRLKEDPRTRDILVVVLSNRDDDDDVKKGIRLGANDYFRKVGTSPAAVSAKIREILDRAEPVPVPEVKPFRLAIRDREQDADALLERLGFARRFCCQACEEEMTIELIPDVSREGNWFSGHFVCPKCGREF